MARALKPAPRYQAAWLPGGRLHLNHGPMDLVIGADGPGAEAGFSRAISRFDGLLEELVAELPALRKPDAPLAGPVARAMGQAVAPFRPAFVTPMAAVAGAVADAVLAALIAGPGISRAYVNNGGDIALHLTAGQSYAVAIGRSGQTARVAHGAGVGGIATSGWRGRSQSLGIADAVTVLAPTAAMADAAATMIANAVDLPGHPAITRRPAHEVKADSDLGFRHVTVDVAPLSRRDASRALDTGAAFADTCLGRGLILGAALFLQSETRILGRAVLPAAPPEAPHG
ncbi:UPF0280 family protein [Aliigemmobacter aestuarii]|uniref:UPF0280 family protein n=1 Tax=Aliigemmobacter aestuarii TaxID=1445661 RepID=A0A4S3MN18_9RHOB|nr:UPF0280 family protein [Gemmobacter aestuarii]THD83719.1 UPF0280 family protein [Gemmobacter aestuarii]